MHLYPEAEVCPLTGEFLGKARLRQRHLALMRWLPLRLSRRAWLELPSSDARADALAAVLAPYVRTVRRPFPELPGSEEPPMLPPPSWAPVPELPARGQAQGLDDSDRGV